MKAGETRFCWMLSIKPCVTLDGWLWHKTPTKMTQCQAYLAIETFFTCGVNMGTLGED
jgi:hypothetical protein